MKVTIEGKEYNFEIGSVWGPTYDYETLTQGKLPYNPQSTLCNHIMIYGILVRSNPKMTIHFEWFLQQLNNVELTRQLMSHYFERLEILAQYASDPDAPGKKKEAGSTRTKHTRKL